MTHITDSDTDTAVDITVDLQRQIEEQEVVILENRSFLDQLHKDVKEINVKTDLTHNIVMAHVAKEDKHDEILQKIEQGVQGITWLNEAGLSVAKFIGWITAIGLSIAAVFEYIGHIGDGKP